MSLRKIAGAIFQNKAEKKLKKKLAKQKKADSCSRKTDYLWETWLGLVRSAPPSQTQCRRAESKVKIEWYLGRKKISPGVVESDHPPAN